MSGQSSLEELNEAIKSYNPFDGRCVVKAQQVWGEEFPDIPLLHSHASNTLIELLEKINTHQLSTFGISILAPKGCGKSHVLSRVRHHLQAKKSGVFIYLCEYGSLDGVKRQFLQGLASSLRKRGSQGAMQCQELATILVNGILPKDHTPYQLINQLHKTLPKNPKIVTQLTEKISTENQDCNPDIIQALVWTLSPVHAPYSMNWLAGRELTQAQADILGLPNSNREDKNVAAFDMACETLNLIGRYTTPVICFDELDGAEYGNESDSFAGFTRAQVVASLAKDVYNKLGRGLIITAMYQRTFNGEVKLLPGSDAVVDRIAQRTIELNLLKSGETIDLVAGWLEDFYARQGLTPPHKVYPFDESKLQEIGDGATVREVLRWCADNFGSVIDKNERIDRMYRETEEATEDFLEDNEKIAGALAFGIQYLKGQTVENLIIEDVDREVIPQNENKGFINFRIIGNEDGQNVKIGVCVLQDSHAKTIGAALKRLTQYEKFDLSRGCLVRAKTINESWAAYKDLQKLLNDMGGEWVLLKEEEVKPLIALKMVARELENYGLEEEDFRRFIEQNRLFMDNPLIREVLSDPSGQVPQGVINEDASVRIDVEENLELNNVPDVVVQAFSNAEIEDSEPEVDTSLLSKTQLATLELHRQGITIGRIAQKRRLSRGTITRHFVEMIEMNQPIDLNLLVPVKRQERIRKAIEKTTNVSSLRSVREHLGDSYTYDEIQLVRAVWLREQAS